MRVLDVGWEFDMAAVAAAALVRRLAFDDAATC